MVLYEMYVLVLIGNPRWSSNGEPREDEKIILIESRLYMNSQWRIPYMWIGNSTWQAPQDIVYQREYE